MGVGARRATSSFAMIQDSGGRQACGRCDMVKFNRTAVTYDSLRKECLETIRQWPGYETIAGIQLISDNSPAGFSAKVTLCGRADKKVATAL